MRRCRPSGSRCRRAYRRRGGRRGIKGIADVVIDVTHTVE